ncbi:cyclic nucleotide-binding protein,PilZ domain-containing protein [Desulfocapsa sulfexigens DSM 10523]|uniref:Cyclic nucleotide-binding protein,PilZ domain-containing protein n=1 Tax=Desulfocapsa sulfexigens (strain DSM 10523 / SB164P1) TaxID=1167006 RepID=M1NJC9_DESSD|nr:cyclic nucleotide-binding domain-containing protein [Desulfocapsa sulfexigens]AGF79669.1 cyclic nucleotide-binding protein,PilZ domain-containing protein [Desulfocapsa sulfexigens DSM 10523]
MDIDIKKQREAQENARKLLAKEEQQRAERRLLKLVLDLENGNSEVLLNDEFMGKLPELISVYSATGNRDRVKKLFEQLGDCACSENPNVRERAVMALSLCMGGLNREEHRDLIDVITGILLRWLRAETLFLSVCGIVCKQLQENGIRMFEEGLWKECGVLLEIFYQIQSGVNEKSNAIRSIVGRSQEAMATDYVLEELTIVCLRGRGERRQYAEQILVHLGRKAAIHLLETLLNCQEKEDRLRLVGLIPATGYAAVPVLKEYLQKKLPWYGIRNIILMITAMDDENLIPLIMPCLSHEDIRIQQQVIDCINEVAVTNPGGYLLAALPVVDDNLKAGLISHLGKLGGLEVVDAFLDLLARRDTFSPNVRDELLESLAIHVRLSDSIRAVNLLTMLLEERSVKYDPQVDPVSRAARNSLHILQPRFSKKELPKQSVNLEPEPPDDNVSFDNDPSVKNPALRQVQMINEEVAVLLGKGQVADASELLYKKCIEAAEEKRFEAAEMLRDRILEVDPNALAEVIKAGERIEEERSSSVTTSHISIWQDLYDSLTTDEFNALYEALKSREYDTGTIIVEQGANSPLLYFINSGQARLTCWRGQDEVFLKKVGPGEIIGTTPFFDVSIWTVALTAIGTTKIHVLEREVFLELIEQFPGIESCLINYCSKAETVPKLLKMSGEDRRQYPRFPVSLLVKHTLLDEYGNASMRSFNGEIVDISCGGFSFFIKISRKENARLLLGRGIKTNITVKGIEPIDTKGVIVAVRFQGQGEAEYSVHVQLDEIIGQDIVKHIIGRS